MKIDFEQYLQEKFVEYNSNILDDDIPDAYADWIGEVDPEDIIQFGQKYAEEIYNKLNK